MSFSVLGSLLLAIAVLPMGIDDGVKLDDTNSSSMPLPAPGGWVLLPDGETLVVSAPTAAELVFINTSEGQETKRVKVDFQPGALALRGSTLFALAKGSSLLFVLDINTGAVKKQIKVPGDKLAQLACHPSTGPLYASTEAFDVVSINPESGKVTKTAAKGNFLAVDPLKGDFLYTGTQKPIRDVLVMSKGPANSVRLGVAKANTNSLLVKYGIKAKELKAVAANKNAAINGRAMALSADGKKIAMAGGGGVESEGGRRSYAIGVFDASDLDTQLGQIETGAYPQNIAFHPVIDLGVAEKTGTSRTFTVFSSRSLAPVASFDVPTRNTAPGPDSGLLLFGGKGTRLIFYQAGSPAPPTTRAPRGRATAGTPAKPAATPKTAASGSGGQLYFVPLELSDEQKAALAKAYPTAKS
jgi:hypothetical protein